MRKTRTRRVGKANFILLGAIGYSALACFFYALILETLAIGTSTFFNLSVAVILIAFGPLWAYSFWFRMEKAWSAAERGRHRALD